MAFTRIDVWVACPILSNHVIALFRNLLSTPLAFKIMSDLNSFDRTKSTLFRDPPTLAYCNVSAASGMAIHLIFQKLLSAHLVKMEAGKARLYKDYIN